MEQVTLVTGAPVGSPPVGPLMRAIAPLYRAVHSARSVRCRTAPWVRGHSEIDTFSPDGRGLGVAVALAEAERHTSLAGSTALILGAGAGTGADLLVPHGVSHIIGADLEAHPTKWPRRRAELARRGVESTFTVMDGADLGLRDAAVDVVFSHSVLEHVTDLDSMLAESRRVLRSAGRFVAWFGPIWTTSDGSHIAQLAYDHLLLDESELSSRSRRVGDEPEGRLGHGLFNKLRYQDYVEAIGHHFEIEWLGVAGSREGALFRDRHPLQWAYLRERHDEFDLLTRLVGVVARPLR